MEKISPPAVGLTRTTLSDPEGEPYPYSVPRLELLAGFSPPQYCKSAKSPFGPHCVGRRNFLWTESPSRRRRWAVAKPIGKIGEQAPRARQTQTVFQSHSTVAKPSLVSSRSTYGWNTPLLPSHPQEMPVGRASAGGGRFCITNY